jgi:hypothetical protein
MPSQLIAFSSSDVGGPGLLTGQAGSLLSILDACLVTTYAGHVISPAWTKPFANSGNIGCYKQGAGAGLSLLINDNGPNGTSTYREAWAVGWESIAGIAAPVGSGSGQFPTPAQLLTTGHVVWRKSETADATVRAWKLFADSSTFYLFTSIGNGSFTYAAGMFGDVFSMNGATDLYRCLIIGRSAENTASYGNASFGSFNYLLTANPGHFMARTWAGSGGSVTICKQGDSNKGWATAPLEMNGAVQTPNGPDNSYYLAPIWISEPSAGIVRGRLRGIYQVCHPIAGFSDGQVFSGGGDYAGKTFQIVKTFCSDASGAGYATSYCAVETSATVETN